MTKLDLAVQFFLQLVVILGVCNGVGRIAARFGQPQVVAEMIAGVLLGPSLFGWLAPDAAQAIFPEQSMDVLYPVSQFGLAAYMFVVGMEFRMDIVRSHLGTSIAVSFAGMAAPFFLGALLAFSLHGQGSLFSADTSMFEAMLFLGASLCITAFPMLARIIHFKGLAGTTMGTVAIGAGAIDDAAAWGLLALVLASFDGNSANALWNIGGGLLYLSVTLGVIRPILKKLADRIEARGWLSDAEFSGAIVLLAAGAWWTDRIGLHAVFGAFLMGAAMPRGVVNKALIERIQPFTVIVLLPLFFVYSGLNTKIGLLNSWFLWGVTALTLIAALVGKGGACWLAARLRGLSHQESLGIGTLMNARGLMELIIINIGFQRGIITAELFAVLAMMAVITTLMASPVFECVLALGTNTSRSKPAG